MKIIECALGIFRGSLFERVGEEEPCGGGRGDGAAPVGDRLELDVLV
jgi:hypothetical protein